MYQSLLHLLFPVADFFFFQIEANVLGSTTIFSFIYVEHNLGPDTILYTRDLYKNHNSTKQAHSLVKKAGKKTINME